MEKTFNSRIIQKHDIEVNWLKAINFIPKQGEIIVYDPDEEHVYSRVKIGDGIHAINELDFVFEHSAIFVGTREEYLKSNVAVGSLVILLDEELEPEQTVYYSSLADALNGTNGSENSNNSAIAVELYSNDEKIITLLQDINSEETISLTDNTIFKLNGHIFNTTAIPAFISNGNNVGINGLDSNSKIEINAVPTEQGTILEVQSGDLKVKGGSYIVNTSGAGTSSNQAAVFAVKEGSMLKMEDAIVIAEDSNNGSVVGISGENNTNINLTGCKVTVSSGTSLENIGINTLGDLTLTNCDVQALANYTANSAGTAYASNSRGIQCSGILKMYNCQAYGAHSGVTTKGSCYIDGGQYSGYGHGGVYLSGNGSMNYLQNAEFSWAPMAENTVSDIVAGTNGAAVYIGGASNQTVYVNNCKFNMIDAEGLTYKDLPLPFYGIVLRTSGKEVNNNVYISNSYVLAATTTMFRGGSNHNVYSGLGNDFSKAEAIYIFSDELFHNTEETYEKIF